MPKQGAISRGKPSLAEVVYGQLLDDIVSGGRWRAGETISAYALSRRLAVSRTPVVEALKRLESEGLIEIVPRVGARLAQSPPDATEEVFSIAMSLLGLAAERAAHRVGEGSLRRMDELIDDVAEAAERGDTVGATRLVGEFQRTLIHAGLPAHAAAGERLWHLLGAQALHGAPAGIRPGVVSELRAIVDALRARSPLRARAAAELNVAAAARERSGSPLGSRASAGARGGLEHSAALYRSKAELIAAALPFMLAGLQRDEPVLLVSEPENIELLGAALGVDGRRVDYRDSAQWCDDPASTLQRFRRYIDERSTDSRVRIVAEPLWSGRSSAEVGDWLRFESIVNVALETYPASIICPYDAEALPPEIVSGALVTHPYVTEAGEISDSPDYREFFRTGAGGH